MLPEFARVAPRDALDRLHFVPAGRAVRGPAMNGSRFAGRLGLLALLAFAARALAGDAAPFDMTGPLLHAEVTRGAVTLPITKVPGLRAGDRVTLRAELPADQSARYLLVVALLRGPTNPPPPDWFFRCETWSWGCSHHGLSIVVPPDAQQLLVLFAPETGGDFKTLTKAVQGRPGAFVRAAQGLTQAGLDRLRLEQYLAGVRDIEASDPAKLKDAAPVLARSLAIKVEAKCLDRIPSLQGPCLTEGQDALILNDGHGTSMVSTLTSGAASDLAIQAGNSSLMSSGAHLPLIGSLLDIARLFDTFHTALYQYIPALALPRGDHLALMLNTPPSFHDPKSVLVAVLAPIDAPPPPPLRAAEPERVYCARREPIQLGVEAAPIVFATGYAHDLALSVVDRHGKTIELPARPDARHGGFAVDAALLRERELDATASGRLHGAWGFDRLDGPAVTLASASAQPWSLAAGESPELVVGATRQVRLAGGTPACVDSVRLRAADGRESALGFELIKDGQLLVRVPLEAERPGEFALRIEQRGAAAVGDVALHAYSEPPRVDGLAIHAGDAAATLTGAHLDQVKRATLGTLELSAGTLLTSNGLDSLELAGDGPAAFSALAPGQAVRASVELKDGRVLEVGATVAAPRPTATLLSQSTERTAGDGAPIVLGSPGDWPIDARTSFSLRTTWSARNFRDGTVEIASVDDAFAVSLGGRDGAVTFESAGTAIVSLVPATALGPAAFGPLKFRLVLNGVRGDWQPLATIVRLPALRSLDCPPTTGASCRLTGSGLFLLDAIAASAHFQAPTHVPDGYTDSSISVPRPSRGKLYLRLRDDPTTVSTVTLREAAVAAVDL